MIFPYLVVAIGRLFSRGLASSSKDNLALSESDALETEAKTIFGYTESKYQSFQTSVPTTLSTLPRANSAVLMSSVETFEKHFLIHLPSCLQPVLPRALPQS